MKLNRLLLLGILERLIPFVSENKERPKLNTVMVEQAAEYLKFTASNGDAFAQTRMKMEGELDKPFCMNAKLLLNIIKKLRDETIDMVVEGASACIMTEKGIKGDFKIEDASDFPTAPAEDIQRSIDISEPDFQKAMRKTAPSLADDTNVRPGVNHFIVNVKDSRLEIASLDGFRISEFTLPADIKGEHAEYFHLPKLAKSIIDSVAINDKGKMRIIVGEKNLFIGLQGFSYTLKKPSFVKINYEKILAAKENATSSFRVDRKDLMDALELISIVSEGTVMMDITEKEMVLSSEEMVGSIKRPISGDMIGDSRLFKISPKLLNDFLKVVDYDTITIYYSLEPLAPLFATSADVNHRFLFLPLNNPTKEK